MFLLGAWSNVFLGSAEQDQGLSYVHRAAGGDCCGQGGRNWGGRVPQETGKEGEEKGTLDSKQI